jgi:putative redox protein
MTVTARGLKNYQVEITAGSHTFLSDEPPDIGGEDTGPNPFALMLGGLAACTVITLHMYARRKGWPLEEVRMTVNMRSEDQETPEGEKKRVSIIDTELDFTGTLEPDQVKRLEQIANKCPVHKTLTGEVIINSSARLAEPQ